MIFSSSQPKFNRLIKKLIIVSTLIFIQSISLRGLDVSSTCLTFWQQEPYLEIYSRILGSTAQFIAMESDSSLVTAGIEFLVVITDDQGKIHIAEKYNIKSPESTSALDFYDMKRYQLSPGKFDIKLQYVDLNRISDTLIYEQKVDASGSTDTPLISDLLLTNQISNQIDGYAFTKAGFTFEPLVYNVLGPSDDKLVFYGEIYEEQNSQQQLYYKYYLMDPETLEQKTKPSFKKLNADPKAPILKEIDIADLPTGKYVLVLEVITKDNELITRKEQVCAIYHPYADYAIKYEGDSKYETSFVHELDEGELNYSLKAIFPRVSNDMNGILNDIIWSEEIEPKRYYLYSFWSKFSPDNAKGIYDEYMNVARAVDDQFASNLGHGFESDRGYVFLKYGKPHDVIDVPDEPSAPPYQIWIYNYLQETTQSNVKFLFYNKDLTPNDYRILHSTCRGEISNPRWEVELYRADRFAPIGNALDATRVQDGFNRNARRYFSDN